MLYGSGVPEVRQLKIQRSANRSLKVTETTTSGFPITLKTKIPEAGFDLAIKLSRLAVKASQPDADIRSTLRPVYANDASSLIAASHVVAVHFQTIATANGYWQ